MHGSILSPKVTYFVVTRPTFQYIDATGCLTTRYNKFKLSNSAIIATTKPEVVVENYCAWLFGKYKLRHNSWKDVETVAVND